MRELGAYTYNGRVRCGPVALWSGIARDIYPNILATRLQRAPSSGERAIPDDMVQERAA